MKRLRLIVLPLLVTAMLLAGYTPAFSQDDEKESEVAISAETKGLLHKVRAATYPYRNVEAAEEAGYGAFLDCFRFADESAMGQHYVNGALVGDDILDALQPEALMYETHDDGTLALVGMEYLVFADVWDPDNTGREPPTLFGQEFSLQTKIPGTPPVWALHLWLWSANPDGPFASFNPLIICPDDAPSVDMAAQ